MSIEQPYDTEKMYVNHGRRRNVIIVCGDSRIIYGVSFAEDNPG